METVNSQLTRTLVGIGPYYYLVQFATAVLLVLAANTAFADFPRLACFMARDKFLPSQFAFRGERLAFTNGIIVLAVVAAVLIVLFQGSVTGLIPLYTVGVFLAFTLSQAGIVVRCWRLREPRLAPGAGGQRRRAPLTTAVVAVVVGVTKFALGAWVVLVLIPAPGAAPARHPAPLPHRPRPAGRHRARTCAPAPTSTPTSSSTSW